MTATIGHRILKSAARGISRLPSLGPGGGPHHVVRLHRNFWRGCFPARRLLRCAQPPPLIATGLATRVLRRRSSPSVIVHRRGRRSATEYLSSAFWLSMTLVASDARGSDLDLPSPALEAASSARLEHSLIFAVASFALAVSRDGEHRCGVFTSHVAVWRHRALSVSLNTHRLRAGLDLSGLAWLWRLGAHRRAARRLPRSPAARCVLIAAGCAALDSRSTRASVR